MVKRTGGCCIIRNLHRPGHCATRVAVAAAAWAFATSPVLAGVPCIVPDNGGGTINLPPMGCNGYVSPDDLHEMINGLPLGSTIQVDARHDEFFNPMHMPGGSLGGEIETFGSFLNMQMNGTGALAGYNHPVSLQVQCETHTGPRTPGDPIQSFPTDMFMLQGQTLGDPDFDLLRITGGTGFGMPSPGHTTLVRQGGPGSPYAVDSFFDVFYRIDFVGKPGGPLGGMSGSTTGTIRMAIGTPSGFCPPPPPPAIAACTGALIQDCAAGGATEFCQPRCVQVNQGGVTVVQCDCREPQECHVEVLPGVVPFCTGSCPLNEQCQETVTPLAVGGYQLCCDCVPIAVDCEPDPTFTQCDPFACPPAPSPAGAPCVVPDNGGGTITLPPAGCNGYVSPDDLHEMINGLPGGSTIQVDARHDKFFNQNEGPGGTLGGNVENFGSFLFMQMQGTGPLAPFNRFIGLQVQCQTHTGPRTPGSPVQSFPTDMFLLQGQIMGDPDFDLLRITAGSGFGMPSPGHTTLVRQGPPGSGFAVDSFFDIEYRIDFIGRPGGQLGGMSGSTTGTIRMAIGTPVNDQCIPRCMDHDLQTGQTSVVDCECRNPNECHVFQVPGTVPFCTGGCPTGTTCNQTVQTIGPGIVRTCCDCVAPPCTTQADCDDNNVCTWDQCTAAGCTHTLTIYGDVNHDGTVDIFDILCVLDAFGGVFTTCTALDTDLAGCPGGDGMHDVFDILGVLDAFAGVNSCNCPGGPSPASPVSDAALRSDAGRAVAPVSLQLVPDRTALRAGQDLIVHVYADGVADFRGYQLAVDASGGRRGTLQLRNLEVDVNHKDYVFENHENYRAQDLSSGRLAGASGAGSVTSSGHAYLGSFTFHASDDASGRFRLAVRTGDEATVLVGSGRELIPLRPATQLTVQVR
ncbi:MAG: hypothetical protein HOP29_01455 [Phycisphaerales bacterium]|nr:hypothetical protein [Phycisphaerales bacterium]